jgi:hypothetical protein
MPVDPKHTMFSEVMISEQLLEELGAMPAAAR